MRVFLSFLLTAVVLMFTLAIIDEATSDDSKDNRPRGTTHLNGLVNQVSINEYFIDNNRYWRACDEQEDKIRDKEPGYELSEYGRYPITNILSGWDYHHSIYKKKDGTYEMDVEITCTYNVRVQLNAFAYADEELSYDGGHVLFQMNVQEDRGHYQLAGMKAYEYIR